MYYITLYYITTDTFIIVTQIWEPFLLYEYDPETFFTPIGLLMLVFMEIRLVLLYSGILLFARAHVLMGIFFIVLLKMLMIKLNMIKSNINNNITMRATTIRRKHKQYRPNQHEQPKKSILEQSNILDHFQVEYIETFVTISKMNNYIGRAFFALILITAPLNCELMYSFLFNQIPPGKQMFVFGVCAQQLMFHFWMHYLFAKVNHTITSPMKYFRHSMIMMECYDRMGRCMHTHHHYHHHKQKKYNNNNNKKKQQQQQHNNNKRLTISTLTNDNKRYHHHCPQKQYYYYQMIKRHNFLVIFTGKSKKYGFTYNSFGRISMASFLKVSL